MQFTVSQRFFFDAAHTLKREIKAEGSRRIHGHTYHAEVWLAGPRNPDTGMVIDLGLLRRRLDEVRELLDHRMLDEVPGLGAPTLENLCLFIANAMPDFRPRLARGAGRCLHAGDRPLKPARRPVPHPF